MMLDCEFFHLILSRCIHEKTAIIQNQKIFLANCSYLDNDGKCLCSFYKVESMKPSFYICGGGSHINCDQWDDVNGCLQDQTDAWRCRKFLLLDASHDDDDMDDGAGGY